MEILQDWKFWGFIINGVITMLGFSIIKFNDFSHLIKDVNKLSKKIDSIDERIVDNTTNIAVLQEKTKDI